MVRDDKREDRKTLEGRVIRERAFVRTIGIDYSGAATPTTRLNNLAVYCADGDAPPQLVHPPADALGRWTRREIAGWLVEHLQEQDIPTLVGIDHSFSFPIRYFREHNVPVGDWDHFLNDFRRYWPTDGDNTLVSAIRDGTGRNRSGEPDSFRLTDGFSATAKSVFLFNVIGAVAHSTHTGIPWLRYIRQGVEERGSRSPLLAFRRVGYSPRTIGHCRGVPVALESAVRPREQVPRPTRCLQRCWVAVKRGSERLARPVFQS